MRTFSSALLALLGFLTIAGIAHAQDYPTRPVTVIVPQAAGGANDAIARVTLQRLSENLKQQFLIDNRAGAGGNLGTALAAKAPKDGYTLMLTVGSAHTINPSLYRGKQGFDPVKDFEPIMLVATAPYVLVANPKFPAKTVKEVIDHIKPAPGKFDYASAGNGTLNHLFGEMFKQAAGLEMTHIPYKGAAAAATDVVGGQIPLTFGSLPGVMPFVRAGSLTLIATATPARSKLIPDTPTIGETLSGFGAVSWYGLFAPAGTPKEIIAKIQGEMLKVLASKDVQDRLATQGAEAVTQETNTPAQLAKLIAEDLVKWDKIVKASKAQID